MRRLAPLLLLSLAPLLALAQVQSGMRELPLGRGDAFMPIYVAGNPQAQATVILLPGGDAGTGKIQNGEPGNGNFLVRSRELFKAAGFNVVIAFRASDLKELDYRYRAGQAHVGELEKAIDFAAREFGKPVWLAGTSRGTVSGTAAAIALGPKVAGLVLTSSVTTRAYGAVPTQDIGSIQVPVLVVHHQRDACKVCLPEEARRMTGSFRSAPVRKFVMVDGGSDPEGDPCEARHWHGFINYEKEAVKLLTEWMLKPQG